MNNSRFVNQLTGNQKFENLGSNFLGDNISRNYVIDENHPLQPSPNTFIRRYKFLNLNSNDRNLVKYPKSSVFSFQLPSSINSITEVTLYNYNFPSNIDTFSIINRNLLLYFSISEPLDYQGSNIVNVIISKYLFENLNKKYNLEIDEGSYTSETMCFEIENKLNYIITENIIQYAKINYPSVPSSSISYNRFKIIFNIISKKISIGNISDNFIFYNEDIFNLNKLNRPIDDCFETNNTSGVDWGLPFNLGFEKKNVSGKAFSKGQIFYNDSKLNNGIWCEPDVMLGNKEVFILNPIYKLNLYGNLNYFIQIKGFDNIDSSLPFKLNLNYSSKTNKFIKNEISSSQTNGITDLYFAKIPVNESSFGQINGFSGGFGPSKYFNPPFNDLKEISIKILNQKGETVDFKNFDYSLLIRFTLISPQIVRTGRIAGGENSLMNLSLLDKQYLQEQNPKDNINPGY